MLIAVFDTETAAALGLQTLQNFHAQGDITMHAAGLMIKDDNGGITVKNSAGRDPIVLAVGSMMGLIGGPAGLPAEIEEDWVDHVDAVLAQSWPGHDISSFKSEILAMESEMSVANGERRAKLLLKLSEAKAQLDAAMHGANRWVDTLEREASAKTVPLEKQLGQAALTHK